MKNSFVANHESWLVRCSPHAQGFNRNNLRDALVYLARPMHKKYSTTFFWSHPFSTYVSYERFRVTPLCVHDFISFILSSPILTLLVCHSFLMLFYLKNWCFCLRQSSLPGFSFSFQQPTSEGPFVNGNCQLFYLSWSLTKLSYPNVKEGYSTRTTTVIVTVLTKVMSFS